MGKEVGSVPKPQGGIHEILSRTNIGNPTEPNSLGCAGMGSLGDYEGGGDILTIQRSRVERGREMEAKDVTLIHLRDYFEIFVKMQ